VPEAMIKWIDPGFFYAWNQVLDRWEVWCDRTVATAGYLSTGERAAVYENEPYYVMRVCVHPRKRGPKGEIAQVCPARPLRYKNAICCPPSCPGVYHVPDERLLHVLSHASYLRRADGPDKVLAEIEESESKQAAYLESYLTSKTQDIWGEAFPYLAGIQSVGMPANYQRPA
jgi:hypothetical protein